LINFKKAIFFSKSSENSKSLILILSKHIKCENFTEISKFKRNSLESKDGFLIIEGEKGEDGEGEQGEDGEGEQGEDGKDEIKVGVDISKIILFSKKFTTANSWLFNRL
jgi:hypothetical protein